VFGTVYIFEEIWPIIISQLSIDKLAAERGNLTVETRHFLSHRCAIFAGQNVKIKINFVSFANDVEPVIVFQTESGFCLTSLGRTT